LPAGLLRLVEQRGQRMTLSGLTEPEVIDLAAQMGAGALSRPAAARLRRHTEGSPLHLRALMSEPTAEQLQAADGPLPAPHSFALQVLSALAAVSPTAQPVARVVAVLGDRAALAEAAQVAGLTDAAQPLEELQGTGTLRLHPESGGWRVR
jgi:hypothetical protein